jgi:hypothetical protein
MREVWSLEHTVRCPVEKEFAWNFWTDVRNWTLDSDMQSVELHGPFATGVEGRTTSQISGRVEWRLADVEPGTAATIEVIPQGGAIARFRWTFEDLDGSARITQRASIEAEDDTDCAEIARDLEMGIPAGMQKLCDSMMRAAAGA